MNENEFLEMEISKMAKSLTRREQRNTRDKILKMFPDRELLAVRHPMGPEVEDDPGDLQSLGLQGLSAEF